MSRELFRLGLRDYHRYAMLRVFTPPRLIGAGIVCVRCACDHQHLIADNLGWFGDAVNIEQMLAERGEEVKRILVDDPEGLHLDPVSSAEPAPDVR